MFGRTGLDRGSSNPGQKEGIYFAQSVEGEIYFLRDRSSLVNFTNSGTGWLLFHDDVQNETQSKLEGSKPALLLIPAGCLGILSPCQFRRSENVDSRPCVPRGVSPVAVQATVGSCSMKSCGDRNRCSVRAPPPLQNCKMRNINMGR